MSFTFHTLYAALSLKNHEQPSPLRAIAEKTVIVTASLAFCALSTEIVLRLVYPDTPGKYYERDPLLWRRLRPNSDGWNSSPGEFRIHVRVNSKGLRGADISYLDYAASRVLMLGDSFLEATQVEEHQTTAAQLEIYLQERCGTTRVEVINAGVSGYSTAQELLYLENEGYRYKPEVVVVVLYLGNDILSNGRYDSVPWESVAPLTARHVAGTDPNPNIVGEEPLIVLLRGRLRQSLAARFVIERLRYLPWLYSHVSSAGTEGYVPSNLKIFSPKPDPDVEIGWITTRRVLERAVRLASKNDMRLVVVVWPDTPEFHDDWWRMRIAAYPAMRGFNQRAPSKRVLAMLSEMKVPHISLGQPFHEAWRRSSKRDHLAYPIDGHPTAFAHALAAQAIGSYILKTETLCPKEEQ